MTRPYILSATLFVSATIVAASCASSSLEDSTNNPSKVEILDDRWNDTDASPVVEAMIASCLAKTWHEDFRMGHGGKKPSIIVADFKDHTDKNIDTKAIYEASRTLLINSGKVQFLNEDQLKADFFLFGAISKNEDQRDSRTQVTYQIEMRLTDIATSTIVWTEVKPITKSL